ncbi:hypothetical protein AMTRI_Chr08g205290 [Amborella trichopoda]
MEMVLRNPRCPISTLRMFTRISRWKSPLFMSSVRFLPFFSADNPAKPIRSFMLTIPAAYTNFRPSEMEFLDLLLPNISARRLRPMKTLKRSDSFMRTLVTTRAFTSSTISPEAFQGTLSSTTYGSEQIQVLEGLDPVRKRPGMYIGSTGPRGLHHLVYEILDNAIDEAQAGFATRVDVVLHSDNSVSITDNGRGIPTEFHQVTKKSALETVLTALEITVWRDGREYQQTYSRGKPVTDLTSHMLPTELNSRQGTCIRFWPDREVFTTTISFDYNTIAGRIRELAFLNTDLAITLTKMDMDSQKAQYNEYCYAGGLVEYVKWLNTDKKPIHDPVFLQKKADGITVDVALQWCSDAYTDTLLGYANSIRTVDGGTHIDGLKASLTRTLNNLGKKSKVIKEDINLSGEHVREGLTCIVSVKVPNPEFEGQTKTRLGNPEVRRVVDQSVQEHLTEYLELHPDILDSVLLKSLNALKFLNVQVKYFAEIFIVEGDSAGGSAKQGRDRRFQAVLPLRGKILNIERKDEAAMYKNEEIQNLILGLGLGVKGEDFRKDALRYHKIIILTDADVDGAHIRTLLLTFFFRYQKSLFDEGCIYVGVPPLFKVERGKQVHYCYNDMELKQLQDAFPPTASYNIQRFKGLGEMMPIQLWETTLDPDKRVLKQLVVEDAAKANLVFSSLMGSRTQKDMVESSQKINGELWPH